VRNPAKLEIKEGNIEEFMESSPRLTNSLLKEVVEQLKLANNSLEEIHDELHELTNRGGGF
jgi:hypothetical protein